jgi:hypothetical protein
VVGLELIGIIAAVTGSLLAGETTRRVAARVVASTPSHFANAKGWPSATPCSIEKSKHSER